MGGLRRHVGIKSEKGLHLTKETLGLGRYVLGLSLRGVRNHFDDFVAAQPWVGEPIFGGARVISKWS